MTLVLQKLEALFLRVGWRGALHNAKGLNFIFLVCLNSIKYE